MKSVEEIVCVIDYSQFKTIRNGKITHSCTDVLDLVKANISLPHYDNVKYDFNTKQITLVEYRDIVTVE